MIHAAFRIYDFSVYVLHKQNLIQTHKHKHIGTPNEIFGLRGFDSSFEQMRIQQIQSLLKGFIRSASSGRKRERERDDV